jgi:hypothetical protein
MQWWELSSVNPIQISVNDIQIGTNVVGEMKKNIENLLIIFLAFGVYILTTSFSIHL